MSPNFIVSSSPHFHSGNNIKRIMYLVVIALLPALGGAIIFFGMKVLWLSLIGIFTAVIVELLSIKIGFGKTWKESLSRSFDGSAIITGLLIVYNIPPNAPFWIPIIGSAFAIIVVKQLFGGLGNNFLNPALAARAFLMASWPSLMTDFSPLAGNMRGAISGITNPNGLIDAVSSATPLNVLKSATRYLSDPSMHNKAVETINKLYSPEVFKSLFIGNIGGVIGETSALLLLLGAIMLLITGIIKLRIPMSYILTVFLLILLKEIFSGGELIIGLKAGLFHILAGGLILGAFFMATDYATCPITPVGQIIFGIGAGILTFLIRMWGGFPEGVSYSILLMNIFTPLINRFTKPRILGEKK